IDDWPELDRLAFEAEAVGFHLTAHPLDAYRPMLRRLGAIDIARLAEAAAAGKGRVQLAGCVVDRKERPTRTGSRMAWLRLSDASGGCEVTLFSEVLSRTRELLVAGQAVLVTAELKAEGEMLRLTASDVASLDQAAREARAELRIWIEDAAAISQIRTILDRERGGRGRVVLVPHLAEGQEVEVSLPGDYAVTPRLGQAIKTISGVERVEER
ncbi:DNA polymerase III subunit alpha, partial [Endobacter medicaginis]|nr:DNA polymerase III subunit alpha [Endobacter medicaginis]